MSDSAEMALTFSVLTCQAEQFMSDSAENRPTFRCIQTGLLCRARSNIFIRGISEVSYLIDHQAFVISKMQSFFDWLALMTLSKF
jgi:hypothetical protein